MHKIYFLLKLAQILLIILTIPLLNGCDNSKETITTNTNTEYNSAFPNIEEDQNYFSDNMVVKAPKGYYFIKDYFLYYWDNDKNITIPVCNKADCTHDGDNCNAYFDETSFIEPSLYYSNGLIYILAEESAESDNIDEQSLKTIWLYSISADGSQRTKLFDLYTTDSASSGADFIIHKNNLYRVDLVNNIYTLYSCDLNGNGSKQILYELDKEYPAGIDNVIGVGNYIYFEELYFKDKEQKQINGRLYRINIETAQLELVLDNFISNQFFVADEDILYMTLDFKLMKRNIKTDAVNEIISPQKKSFFEFSYDQKYVYINDNESDRIEVYDLNGNKIADIKSESGGTVMFGDQQYLFMNALSDHADDTSMIAFDKRQLEQKEQNWINLSN